MTISERIPCKYSVVKYVEDQIKDEPVNIGIILHSKANNKVSSYFVDTQKLKYYFDNTSLVKALIQTIDDEISKNGQSDILSKIAKKHSGKLRFTEYRGTLAKSMETEIKNLFKRFISIEQPITRQIITIPYLKKQVWDFIEGKAPIYRNQLIGGKRSKFRYDFVFGNNDKIFHSISYDSQDALKKTKLFDWNARDAISANGLTTKNFGAIISEPSEKNPKYHRMREHFKEGQTILKSREYDLIYFDDNEKWKKQIPEFYS